MTAKSARAAVDGWNAAHPIGTPVLYYSYAYAPPFATRTRSAAELRIGNVPAIFLEGRPGFIHLPHVHPCDDSHRPLVTRALTLRQPWATAITAGPKDGENRGRYIFTPPEGGLWTAIHAGVASPDWSDLISVRRLWRESPEVHRLSHGAVVGVVRFLPPDGPGQSSGPWTDWRDSAQWWYPRAEAFPIAEAVTCKGSQGLWTLPPDVAEAVRVQLPSMAAA